MAVPADLSYGLARGGIESERRSRAAIHRFMIRITWGILPLLATVAVPACGGDSSDFSPRTAGSGGSASGSGGRSSGLGGSSQTGGSNASGATGGSLSAGHGGTTGEPASGGSSGSATRAGNGGTGEVDQGGRGGDVGEAGAAGNDTSGAGAGSEGCPSTMPANEASCSAPSMCSYGDTQCDCGGMEDALRWHCHDAPPDPPGAAGGPPVPPDPPGNGGAPEMPVGGRPGGPMPGGRGGRGA